jgi:hypothetical protein
MSCTHTRRGARRPHPIQSTDDAAHLFSLAMRHPMEHETLAFLLDDSNHGNTIVAVSGTEQPHDVRRVVKVMALAGGHDPRWCGLVVASVRPDAPMDDDDLDRWWDLEAIADIHGVQLVEWLVISPDGCHSPRAALGVPGRW